MDMPDIATDLGCSIDVVHLTVAVFVFGFGVGPLVFAPASEVIGRRPVIVRLRGLLSGVKGVLRSLRALSPRSSRWDSTSSSPSPPLLPTTLPPSSSVEPLQVLLLARP